MRVASLFNIKHLPPAYPLILLYRDIEKKNKVNQNFAMFEFCFLLKFVLYVCMRVFVCVVN